MLYGPVAEQSSDEADLEASSSLALRLLGIGVAILLSSLSCIQMTHVLWIAHMGYDIGEAKCKESKLEGDKSEEGNPDWESFGKGWSWSTLWLSHLLP